MKKIRCLLVDDEPLAISLLQNHIAQLDFLAVAGVCANAMKAIEAMKKQEIDLLFLDIRMPQIGGLDLLKMLRNPPPVILTTAYREYALEGYDLDIIDYLLKPITFERFYKAVERYLKTTEKLSPAGRLPAAENEFILIRSGYKQVKVDLADILYLESVKDYVKFHTIQGQLIAKYKISEIEAKLSAKGFLRVHRSYLVNINRINAFTANDIEIANKEIPIGESYKSYVQQALKQP